MGRGIKGYSKMMFNASLFHNPICNMPDTDFSVYGEIPVGDRAVPNIMVTPAMPHKITAKFLQDLAYFLFIFRHYAKTA
jgi:hypothetical protein